MFATDGELRCAVQEELSWDPRVVDDDIRVSAANRVVTLRGTVGSCAQEQAARADAECIPGVVRVDDALQVDLPETSRRDDVKLRATIESVLASRSTLCAAAIEVRVNAGWVTLSGNVGWNFQRLVAADAASGTIGVCGVTNDIEIAPAGTPPEDLRSAIRRAALRHTATKQPDFSIDVSTDGVVSLHGVAVSLQEREMIATAAYSAPGVAQVVNDIKIV